MSLKNDAFPSSAAFDAIQSALTSDEAEKKNAIKNANAVFAFIIKNDKDQTESWYIDLKDKGEVGKGEGPGGKKADVTLVLSEESFGKLVSGKGNAQNMFMQGKLKIRGNMMKATKLQPILSKAQTKAKL